MNALGFIRESLWSILALSATGLFWRWSLAGWRRLAHGPSAHVFRRRNLAVTVGLAPCLVLTAAALPAFSLLSPYVIAVQAAGALCAHAALDPAKAGFWHHRRLRPIFLLLAFGAGLFLAAYLPRPELIPVIFAAAIFHRHQRGGVNLTVECFADLEGLRAKVTSLETSLALRPEARQRGDKGLKAG